MRDQLIQFIYARLARYSQWQDASDILDEDLRTKAFELLELVGQQAVDLQAVAAVACVFWLRSRLLPEGQDEADRQIAVDLYRIIHQVSPQAVPPELRSAVREEGPAGRAVRVDPKMAYRVLLINLNAALGVGDATKVSTCINVLQRLLDAMPADHTDRPEIMAILAAGHGGLYQITNDPADLDAEISILQSCTHDSGRTDSDFASQLQLLGDALEQRFRRAGEPADLDAAIRARRRTLALTAAGDPDRETRAYRLGTLLLTRAGRVGHLNDLDEGIEALQAACTTRDKGPDRCPWLYELGNGLLERYNRKYQPADLDAAITAYTDALSATDTSSPLYALYAVHAAHALQQRFNLRDDLTDCDAAIRTLRRALSEQATAQLPDDLRATQLGALGVALHERYLAVGDINDIHAAADGFRAAASSVHVSNQFQARMLIGLGVAVSLLHLHSGDESYWAESLEVYTAVAKSPAAGPNLRDQAAAGCAGLHRRRNDPAVPGPVVRSQELAAAIERLRGKGRTEQGLDELNQTIVYTQRLLSLSEPGDPASVRHMVLLGEDLLERHHRTSWISDAHEALRIALLAVDSGTASRSLAAALCTAANAWAANYDLTHDPDALQNAITAATRSIEELPPEDPNQAWPHNTLATCLMRRYEQGSDIDDARRAAAEYQRALSYIVPGDLRRGSVLSNLANTLRKIYDGTGDVLALDESIDILRRAAAEGKPSVEQLYHLGVSYLSRYYLTIDFADLSRARQALEQAVADLPPSDKYYPIVVYGLCEAIFPEPAPELDAVRRAVRRVKDLISNHPPSDGIWHHRLGLLQHEAFRKSGNPQDLQLAVDAWRKAVELTPAGHSERGRMLAGLANTLRDRYEKTHRSLDLHEAEALARQCIAELPDQSSLLWPMKLFLKLVLDLVLETAPDAAIKAEVIRLASEISASTAVPPQVRALQAGEAALMYAEKGEWRAAAEHFELAVSLLPFVAPDRALRDDVRVLRPGRLAANGAACWLNVGEPERAVVLLELGRAVFISRVATERAELAALRAKEPELAARFETLRGQLDRPDPSDSVLGGLWEKPAPTINRAATAAELDELLNEIRSVRGHERFLLRPKVQDLLAAAADGPVILLNASQYRCDALALTPQGVRMIPLPGVNNEFLARHGVYIQMTAANAGNRDLTARDYDDFRIEFAKTLTWLWDEIAGPILQKLGITSRPDSDRWPRLWWVPDGAFAWLPLHAAGHHDERHAGDAATVLDRAQSSYIPSVSVLMHARARASTNATAGRVLVVAMPKTPGQHDLPAAQLDVQAITDRFSATVLGTTPGAGRLATRKAIMEELPRHAIAHFACHAYGDWADPMQSFLAVQNDPADSDDTLPKLRLADITSLDLKDKRFACLSACATARPTNIRLLDEAMHLGSGFLLAGFTHVIGTLWEIDDQAAAEFTKEIYTNLETSPSVADPSRAASALHQATRTLRERLINAPVLWASHVYMGP